MKRIGVICKIGRPEPIEILKDFLPWLKGRGLDVFLDIESAKQTGEKGYQRSELPALVEAIVVLGGDGTMLGVARLACEKGIPILGVNLGGLGFITEVYASELLAAMDMVLDGTCPIEERMMLKASIFRGGGRISDFTVLNDVVVNKGALARIIDIEATVGDSYLALFKSDGLVVATPTGSTAYSLSAGGPIVHPAMDCILITPICPHTLTNRPIVIPTDQPIRLTLRSGAEDVFLTLDGQVGFSLRVNDTVEIVKSRHKTRILLPCTRDYYQVLREKLKWGER